MIEVNETIISGYGSVKENLSDKIKTNSVKVLVRYLNELLLLKKFAKVNQFLHEFNFSYKNCKFLLNNFNKITKN